MLNFTRKGPVEIKTYLFFPNTGWTNPVNLVHLILRRGLEALRLLFHGETSKIGPYAIEK